MGFGGTESAMIASLKNNSRKKEKIHFDRKGITSNGSNEIFTELLKKKATPEQLAEIREKVKAERRKALIKTIILTVILFTAFYFGIKLLFS
jgi:hypothetical protein